MPRLALATLLTVSSAVLYGLTFPPSGWKLVAFVAIAPFLVALRLVGIRVALGLAWLWCVAGAVVAGDWFPRAVADYFGQPLPVALGLFAGVFTFMAAPYFMLFAWAWRALSRHPGPALPFLAAAAWVTAEIARGRLLTGTPLFIGNPWGLAGYAQVDWLPMLQIASLTGIYGVSFVVVCVNAALAEVALSRAPAARRLALVGLAALPALSALGYGLAVLRGADETRLSGTPVRVLIAQGNAALGTRWRRDYYGRNLDIYLKLTHEAAQADTPTLAFWPESAMTFFLETEPLYRRSIARLLAHHDLELVAGAPRIAGEDGESFTNSIFVLDPSGQIRGRYDKEYLVPFSEYFPLQLDLLKRRFGNVRAFRHGTETAPLPTRAGLAGVLVCNEAMLPEVAGARVGAGASYLVNPSNDTWISDPKYVEQQFDIATVRAIEQHRYLVRASTAGPSAVIDPWGRVQVRTAPLAQAAVIGEIRPLEARTVYGRVGDLFALSCGVAVVLTLVGRRLRSGGVSRT